MNSVLERSSALATDEQRALLRKLLRQKALAPKTRPVSFAQQRMWLLDQLEPGNLPCVIPFALHFTGRLRAAVLEHSLNEIVRRHEALRTTFSTLEGQPVQVIAPTLTLRLPEVDLRMIPEAEREAEVSRHAAEAARQSFDLRRGPLIRPALLRLDEQEYVLLVTMHQIIADGWSGEVFLRELAALYAAFSTGKPSPLPDLPIQYADFARWQRQWMHSDIMKAQLSYWRQQLGGRLPVLELPTGRPRPAVQSIRGASQPLRLSRALTEAIVALSRREDATLSMTLLAAFKMLLYRYTGQEDLLVGSPIANRSRPALEGLIGFFANTLALRTDLSGEPNFRELLRRVRAVMLEAYAHQDLPFERLMEEFQPDRDVSCTPLFQAMFVLKNMPMSDIALPGVTVRWMEVQSGMAPCDLLLTIVEDREELSGALIYNTDLFDATTARRMIEHFQTLLKGIVADPDVNIDN